MFAQCKTKRVKVQAAQFPTTVCFTRRYVETATKYRSAGRGRNRESSKRSTSYWQSELSAVSALGVYTVGLDTSLFMRHYSPLAGATPPAFPPLSFRIINSLFSRDIVECATRPNLYIQFPIKRRAS